MMKWLLLPAFTLAFVGSLGAETKAQEAKDIIGAWAQVGNVNIAADGRKTEAFGPNPKGQALFGANGRYAIILHRPDMPKVAANNRMKATAEENAAILGGLIAFYGSYTVANKIIVLKIEGSTFPNWAGVEQRRFIKSLSGDELIFGNEGGAAGGTNEVTFKRIK
jgi:hypothetical protein